MTYAEQTLRSEGLSIREGGREGGGDFSTTLMGSLQGVMICLTKY